jgi:hypothetical protein
MAAAQFAVYADAVIIGGSRNQRIDAKQANKDLGGS